MKTARIIAVLLACQWAIAAVAVPHYVSLDGTNNSPYLNWADASTNVLWAVAVAGAGDTVIISNGTYYLTNQIAVTQGSITIQGIDSNYNSVLLVGCPYAGQTDGVTSRVMQVTGSNAFISGVTITNGQTTNASQANVGAGIWDTGASLTISNCLIAGNISAAGAFYGVAVFIQHASEHAIKSCVISDNQPTAAGGNASALHLQAGKLTVTNSVITRNRSVGFSAFAGSTSIVNNCIISTNGHYGGATLSGSSRLTGCIISANTNTTYDAGGLLLNHPDIVVSNCIISDNTGEQSGLGGGILLNAAASGSAIVNSLISGNRPVAGAIDGAGIYLQGQGTVRNCVFSNNSPVSASGNGGALYCISSNSVVQDCLFVNNRGGALGGAIYVHAAATNNVFYNCTIVSNYVGANGGGGVYLDNATNFFYNCLIYSNKVASGVGADVFKNVSGATSFFYSCTSSNLLGPGNITNAPLFSDFTNSNFRLAVSSPCINAGTNQAWMTGAVDLDGFPRQDRVSGLVDIGAYERVPTITIFSIR